MNRVETTVYDVAICGAGLAGLTLARQIKRALPHASILLMDRLTRPLPTAAFKVGESSVEIGAHYLGEKLGLSEYFDRSHFHKLGLRYFFGDTHGSFEKRPEFGLSHFPKVNSYQMDRGVLESDLRQMNADMGIELMEGVGVQDILLSEDGTPHQVVVQNRENRQVRHIQARWVVDATGRRRLLQKKLGLARERTGPQCSASWFRYEGQLNLDDMAGPDQAEWHARVPDRKRYFSTNHLMGPGYWVWFIPLAPDSTSVGIVTHTDVVPFKEHNTFERSMQWLRTNEPAVADFLEGREPLDFKVMRHYSHTSRQVFSEQRWACVGESGVFADPFYSPGTDMIGFANTITTEMIRLDFEGELTAKQVSGYNQFLIGFNDSLTDNIQFGYPFFGHATVSAAKLLWDFTAAWSFVCPQMFNSFYLDAEKSAQVRSVTAPYFFLARRLQQMLADWAALSPGRLTFEFIDYLSLEFLHKLRQRNLQTGKNLAELLADQEENMARVEELAQVLFLLAVEDVMPEFLDRIPEPIWLNPWAMSLKPERWEKDGLFRPKSQPRDLSEMRQQIRSMFKLKETSSMTSPVEEPLELVTAE